jgi:hypothetical protein
VRNKAINFSFSAHFLLSFLLALKERTNNKIN